LLLLPILVQSLGITVSTSLFLWNGKPAMSCFSGSNKWSACCPYCSCYFHQNTGCIKMIGAVWKLIIFTSMVQRLINTSRNERVTPQVYDTCLQMFLFFGPRRKDCLIRSTLSSDTCGRTALFSFTKAPHCLELLIPASYAIRSWGITVELLPECPLNRNELICASQIVAHKTPSALE
jgi:hypothetical protein